MERTEILNEIGKNNDVCDCHLEQGKLVPVISYSGKDLEYLIYAWPLIMCTISRNCSARSRSHHCLLIRIFPFGPNPFTFLSKERLPVPSLSSISGMQISCTIQSPCALNSCCSIAARGDLACATSTLWICMQKIKENRSAASSCRQNEIRVNILYKRRGESRLGSTLIKGGSQKFPFQPRCFQFHFIF